MNYELYTMNYVIISNYNVLYFGFTIDNAARLPADQSLGRKKESTKIVGGVVTRRTAATTAALKQEDKYNIRHNFI